MRLINSGDVKKLLDEKMESEELFDFDEDASSPCWEAKVDRDNNKLSFLIDGVEITNTNLSNYKESEITIERLSYFIQILKSGDYDKLSKEIKNDC